MSAKTKKGVVPVAMILNLLIVFEILFMISPFALYYYSAYGPSLNFLHNWPQTAWLTGFFLPHFSVTSSGLINALNGTGRLLFLAGLCFFLVGAAQIYSAKFAKKSAVTGGLYRHIRHPQYTAFAIMGLGVLLVWPRFVVLLMFVTMLFVYYFLAKKEENDCLEKFDDAYKEYLEKTHMFVPGRRVRVRRAKVLMKTTHGRIMFFAGLYLAAILLSVAVAFGLRNYALTQTSIYFSQNMATVSTAQLPEKKIAAAVEIALAHPEVRERLQAAGYGQDAKFLNYLVPAEWILADLPLEDIPEDVHGHLAPRAIEGDSFKLLFTRAKIAGDVAASGMDMVKRTFGREPVVVVRLRYSSAEILAIETPPPHVLWGDIPTPLF